jgi:hypothetical protein
MIKWKLTLFMLRSIAVGESTKMVLSLRCTGWIGLDKSGDMEKRCYHLEEQKSFSEVLSKGK